MLSSLEREVSLEDVVEDMPAALVIVALEGGSVIYANRTARRHAAAYGEGPLFEPDGSPVASEARPHVVAARGQGFEHRVVELRGEQSVWLVFHAHVLARAGVAVLTFEDVTTLHDAQTDLRDAVAARDELVSMAGHELRSPISALCLVMEQIQRKHKLDDVQKLADIGARQVKRLTVLVGNLLDVTRLRAGRFELDRERASLGAIVEQACESLRDMARVAGASLAVDVQLPADGEWDPVRMEQVIVNLVTNALKYGAGTPVHVSLRAWDGGVELAVEDSGPGIPAEQHERIFEPFHRANDKLKAQSLGLGLYIVREIVRAHGGSIDLDSRPGRTRFAIHLPVFR